MATCGMENFDSIQKKNDLIELIKSHSNTSLKFCTVQQLSSSLSGHFRICIVKIIATEYFILL